MSDIDSKRFLSNLEQYVNLETPSREKELLDKMSTSLKDDFKAASCKVKVHERKSGNILECRLGNGKKQILLLGHIDTVFPVGTVSKRSFSIKNGNLYGPGVLDMKAGVLMILEIMRYFQDNIPEDWSICALINADEEVGSADSQELITNIAKESDYCICFEPCKPSHCTVGRKGIISFKVEFDGISAHSGVNYESGHSAIQALCQVVSGLYDLRDDEKGISVNVGTINGGGKSNIVADKAEFSAEVRYYEPSLKENLTEKISQICQKTFDSYVKSKLEFVAVRPPMTQDAASKKLFELAKECAKPEGLELKPRIHGGGSDASFVSAQGVPVLDGMGAEGDCAHTDDEFAKYDTLIPRLKMNIALISSLLGL